LFTHSFEIMTIRFQKGKKRKKKLAGYALDKTIDIF
jgi:hypothetical protein